MSCHEIQDLIPLSDAGVLDPKEAAVLADHLDRCEACLQRSADRGAALDAYGSKARAVPVPVDAVWERIAAELSPPSPPSRGPSRPGATLGLALAGVAAIGLAAAIGIELFEKPRPPSPQPRKPLEAPAPAAKPAAEPAPEAPAKARPPADDEEAEAPIEAPAPVKRAPRPPRVFARRVERSEQDGVLQIKASGGKWPLPVRVSTRLRRAPRFFGSEINPLSGGAGEILELLPPASKSWKPANIGTNALRLKVGEEQELPLRGLQIRVRVDGFLARVMIDGLFENDSDRRYEGRFQLRLPDGASPYYLAFGETVLARRDAAAVEASFVSEKVGFDPEAILQARAEVWKAPMVARVVPRSQALNAYKSTVRRRIDPALMEWAGAGIFQARVFPLMPRKTHRIVVAYDVPLITDRAERVLSLDLPDAPHRVVDLAVKPIPGVKHRLKQAGASTLKKAKGRYRFVGSKLSRLDLRLRTPGTRPRRIHGEFFAMPGGLLLTDTKDAAGPRFAANFKAAFRREDSAPTRRAVFLVDTSLSARAERFPLDLALLEAILEQNRGALKEFAVLFFNVEARWYRQRFIANERGAVEDLMRYAEGLALEGSTNLDRAIDEATKPSWTKTLGEADLFLLGDGGANWGDADPRRARACLSRPGVGALFAYRDGGLAADGRLVQLAEASGGAVFTVAGPDRVAAAARAHRGKPWQITGLSLAGARDLFLAGRPRALFPGQLLTLLGRGIPEAKAKLRLSLRRGEESKELEIPLDYRTESNLASRAYGQAAVAGFEAFSPGLNKSVEDYAVHYRVPGRTCSLLMLESEADYKRFGIRAADRLSSIREGSASELVAEIEAETLGGDAYDAFWSWLERLKVETPIRAGFPAEVKLFLESCPIESFVPPPDRPRGAAPLLTAENATRGEADRLAELLTAAADRRWSEGARLPALQALSSLVELRQGNRETQREVGLTLLAWGRYAEAYHLYGRLAKARPAEAQAYRVMALCAAELDKPELAIAWYELATLLWPYTQRADSDQLGTVVYDYLRLLKRLARSPEASPLRAFARKRIPAFAELDAAKGRDMVVLLSWNSPEAWHDLQILEPGGEVCGANSNQTTMGGLLTGRNASDLGPMVYRLPVAGRGVYEISTMLRTGDFNRSGTRHRVCVTIILNWGRENEVVTRRVLTVRERGVKTLVAKVVLE